MQDLYATRKSFSGSFSCTIFASQHWRAPQQQVKVKRTHLLGIFKPEQEITKFRAKQSSGCSSDLELMHFDPSRPSESLPGPGFDRSQERRK